MAAAGRAPLKPPPPSLHVPQRHEGASASHRASPATSATGSAMSAGSTYSPADDRSDGDPGRTRKGRRRRQPSGSTRGSGSTSPSWAESSMWADQQVGPDRSMGAAVAPGAGTGSSSRNTPVGGTPVDDQTPVRRRTPARINGTPPLVATVAGSRTPPFAPGAPGTAVEESRVSCPRCHGFIGPNPTVKEGDVAGTVMKYSPNRHEAVTAMRGGFSAGEGARVAPPPPINTRPPDTVVNRASAGTVKTPPMVRPPPPRTTAPSPPAPPPPSQRAPSPPAGGNTGGGPRGGGGGGGLRAPEPPPVQAPLPPTTETRDRDGSSEWRWTSMPGGGSFETLVAKSEFQEQGIKGLGMVAVSEEQLGLTAEGLVIGDLDFCLGGQGHGAPEGLRPPRLRMCSNSNHDASRAAVPKYNDKRLSYKFSDKGALTLKNFGLRIGRGGVRDYSEEVLSPTGHNGHGTVGPFFSSSGGGDQWVSQKFN